MVRTHLKVCIGEFPADITTVPDQFVYFLRVTEDMVPVPNSSLEAAQQLPQFFEVSVINGHSLDILEQLLSLVRQLHFILNGYKLCPINIGVCISIQL